MVQKRIWFMLISLHVQSGKERTGLEHTWRGFLRVRSGMTKQQMQEQVLRWRRKAKRKTKGTMTVAPAPTHFSLPQQRSKQRHSAQPRSQTLVFSLSGTFFHTSYWLRTAGGKAHSPVTLLGRPGAKARQLWTMVWPGFPAPSVTDSWLYSFQSSRWQKWRLCCLGNPVVRRLSSTQWEGKGARTPNCALLLASVFWNTVYHFPSPCPHTSQIQATSPFLQSSPTLNKWGDSFNRKWHKVTCPFVDWAHIFYT